MATSLQKGYSGRYFRLLLTALFLLFLLLAQAGLRAEDYDSCVADCGFRHNVDRTFDGRPVFRGPDAGNQWAAYQKCLERCEEKSLSIDDPS